MSLFCFITLSPVSLLCFFFVSRISFNKYSSQTLINLRYLERTLNHVSGFFWVYVFHYAYFLSRRTTYILKSNGSVTQVEFSLAVVPKMTVDFCIRFEPSSRCRMNISIGTFFAYYSTSSDFLLYFINFPRSKYVFFQNFVTLLAVATVSVAS